MIESSQHQTRPTIAYWTLVPVALVMLTTAVLVIFAKPAGSKSSRVPLEAGPLAVSRTNLVLLAGRLCIVGQTNPFNGIIVEHSPDGPLRSRSAVTNGLLHGLSEGWHTNGQLQVAEHFKEGVSHGVRAKWYADGTKLSEAMIVEGRLNGPFRRWHQNGTLAEEVAMNSGQPDGIAKAYFPNGSLKSQATLKGGTIIEQRMWKDGEGNEQRREPRPLPGPQNLPEQ